MGALIAKLAIKYRKPIAKCILGFFIFIVVITLLIFSPQSDFNGGMATDNQNLSDAVLKWQPQVEKYAKEYDALEFVPYILALMQIESGGKGGDPMQASESLGYAPNTIKNPERSIQRGVEFFVENVKNALGKGADLKTALQSYNYGPGFIDFVVANGGRYSFKLAEQFSYNLSGGKQVTYINALSTSMGYNYRYDYGNMFYVPKLLEYVAQPQPGKGGMVHPLSSYQTMISSGFDFRYNPVTGVYEFHTGLDFAVPQGTAVVASQTGTVVRASDVGDSYGVNVVIQGENDLWTRYAHLSKASVREGQEVRAGDKIGEVGSTGRSTGPHLHFEVLTEMYHGHKNPREYIE